MNLPEQKPVPPRMNLTPMIDVVFLLIIFFVVSNTMMQRDRSMPIDLPETASGEESPETETGKIILNIDRKGALYLGASPITREELRGALAKEKENAPRGLEVRIRSDRTVPYSQVEPVLLLCAETGITEVSFAVLTPAD